MRRPVLIGGVCFFLGAISLALAQTAMRPDQFIATAWTWTGAQTFGPVIAGVITDSTTSRTLSATDCGKTILFTNGSAITVTTLNSLVVGCSIAIEQGSTGQVTVSNGAGATMTSSHTFTKTFNAAGAMIGLFVDTNAGGSSAHFVLTGDGA